MAFDDRRGEIEIEIRLAQPGRQRARRIGAVT
jgi:hypothetical protein